jgi:hypothetical protein
MSPNPRAIIDNTDAMDLMWGILSYEFLFEAFLTRLVPL